MKREWKPGEVVAGLIDGNEVVGIVRGGGRRMFYADSVTTDQIDLKHVRNLRPLVVIDPEDLEQVQRLLDLWFEMPNASREMPARMRYALLEFASPTPPKPEEPTVTGSRVVDMDGEMWVRHAHGMWACLNSRPGLDVRTWDELVERYSPIEVQP